MISLMLLFFFVVAILMIISKDGFLNNELDIYQKTLKQPWINRLVFANKLDQQ